MTKTELLLPRDRCCNKARCNPGEKEEYIYGGPEKGRFGRVVILVLVRYALV